MSGRAPNRERTRCSSHGRSLSTEFRNGASRDSAQPFKGSILDSIPETKVNGDGPRAPNVTNILFDGIEGEAIVIALDLRGFCVSSGAACSSGAVEPSHVLTAMGLTKSQARSCIRFSLGLLNTVEQVDALVSAVIAAVSHLRRLSPVYA
ncbi:MAG: aminotransferase class V-fold PLP-dependent enzyme [Bryobacteraceae bacterium]